MALHLPGKGCFSKDTSNMWDPHKVGNVLWARIPSGEMVPVDLHGRISSEDAEILNQVYGRLRMFRKIRPALEVLKKRRLENPDFIKPYLMETMVIRAEAREMIATGDWEAIWSYL